jgi:hypothetical protein
MSGLVGPHECRVSENVMETWASQTCYITMAHRTTMVTGTTRVRSRLSMSCSAFVFTTYSSIFTQRRLKSICRPVGR